MGSEPMFTPREKNILYRKQNSPQRRIEPTTPLFRPPAEDQALWHQQRMEKKKTKNKHTKKQQSTLSGEDFCCLLFVGCLTYQQHANASQGRICSDNCTCCHTEIEVTDQTFHLTQSQYTDTGPTSPSTDPITPGSWQGIATGVPIFKSLV